MSILERERTSPEVIMYALYLYFLGLSFRDTLKAIQPLFEEKERSHVAIWKWVQRFNPKMFIAAKECQLFKLMKPWYRLALTKLAYGSP
jgi:hypothetical protein